MGSLSMKIMPSFLQIHIQMLMFRLVSHFTQLKLYDSLSVPLLLRGRKFSLVESLRISPLGFLYGQIITKNHMEEALSQFATEKLFEYGILDEDVHVLFLHRL